MKQTVMVALVAILAVAANRPAPETAPVTITIVNGRMAVVGNGFQADADRVECDTAKTSVVLEGLNGKAVTFRKRTAVDGQFDVVVARKITFNYGSHVVNVEGAISAESQFIQSRND